MSLSVTARVLRAIDSGFAGTAKELAASLDVDVRRVYHARSYRKRNPRAGTRHAQPKKRRSTFTIEDLGAMRAKARSVPCPACDVDKHVGCEDIPNEAFEYGVHVLRARAAGCPPMPDVASLNAGVVPEKP